MPRPTDTDSAAALFTVSDAAPDANYDSHRSGELLGTAFACSPTFALTAFHCVGDRETKTLTHETVTLRFASGEVDGKVVHHDSNADYAVIKLADELPPDVAIPQLASSVMNTTPFVAKGWAAARPFTNDPVSISGIIVDHAATIFGGTQAVQLHCNESAAGLELAGMSGAPVVVHGDDKAEWVSAIIRWNPPRDDDPGLAHGGIVYACPAWLPPSNFEPLFLDLPRSEHGVYIAYAEADRAIAEQIYETLSAQGIRATARFRFSYPGDVFAYTAEKVLDTHRVVLIVLETSDLDYIAKAERKIVRQKPGCQLVPVLVSHVKPPSFLKSLTPIDLAVHPAEETPSILLYGLAQVINRPSRGGVDGVPSQDRPLFAARPPSRRPASLTEAER